MAGDVFDGVRTEPEQSMLGSNFAPYFAVGVGMTFGRYFDLEVSGQSYELRLEPPGGGSSEYAVFPVLVQPKLHFPLEDLRLDPYVLVGVGFESTELNDSSGEDEKVSGNALGVIGAFGGGLDWFVTSDIAFGLEAKYVVSHGHTLRVGDGPELNGNLDALFLSLGVRAYVAEF
jgi:opacity protein-like surface antigen